jgi:hypothetical protein
VIEIPEFDEYGNLPPGVHFCEWKEFLECEKKNYKCASFVEILEISCALGLEFKMAVMQGDFEEIEAVKKSAKEWRDQKMKKASQLSG